MKVSAGLIEEGVVVGNLYDKYRSSNPVVRMLMHGFESSMAELVSKVKPKSIHEVGCGEGYWTLKWLDHGIAARGSDFSQTVIDLARANALHRKLPAEAFNVLSIYQLNPEADSAQLVVCAEVLEHLERPEEGLQRLWSIASPYLIISVPREPLWRVMNMVRGKYWRHWGNTPGHLQSWSQSQFLALVSRYFEILEIKYPIPWTMLLCRRK